MITATANGSAPQLWNAVQESDGSWSFVNKNSGLCLDVYGGTTEGQQMDQWPCKYALANNQDFYGSPVTGKNCGTPQGSGTYPCVWYGPEVTNINVDYSSAALIQ